MNEPCPVCTEKAGFHDRKVHDAVPIPEHLTWGPDEPPPWDREQIVVLCRL